MQSNWFNRIVLPGLVCAGCMAASVGYAVGWNDARLVKPTDFSSYVFRPQDLPMLVSTLLVTLYVFYLAALVFRYAMAQRRSQAGSPYSRSVNPKLGFLGLLGFLGFAGIWTCRLDSNPFPFVFFIFFGFFGFFYEGRLSHTLMDERFHENKIQAQLTASRIALTIIFLATVLLSQGALAGSLALTFAVYLAVVSLTLGLNLFLGEYLLYHYDHDEQPEEE